MYSVNHAHIQLETSTLHRAMNALNWRISHLTTTWRVKWVRDTARLMNATFFTRLASVFVRIDFIVKFSKVSFDRNARVARAVQNGRRCDHACRYGRSCQIIHGVSGNSFYINVSVKRY